MERTENTDDVSHEAQQYILSLPGWKQIMLLARDLEADTITIEKSSTI